MKTRKNCFKKVMKLMKKRYYRIVFLKFGFLAISSIVLSSILLSLCFSTDVSAEDTESDIQYKYYTVVEVEDGDTLWKYAEEYRLSDQESHDDYIEEVKSINHLNDESIIEGTKLVLPYYSTEYLCSK